MIIVAAMTKAPGDPVQFVAAVAKRDRMLPLAFCLRSDMGTSRQTCSRRVPARSECAAMVRSIVRSAVLLLLLSSPAFAGDFNIYLANAKSETNRHGQSRFFPDDQLRTDRPPRRSNFSTLSAQCPGRRRHRLLRRAPAAKLVRLRLRRPRRLRARGVGALLHPAVLGSSSTLRPDADLGTGPMWSNRRIPAATSKLNFNSQLGTGVALLPERQDAAVHRLSLLSHLQRRLHWPQPRLERERILRRDAREVTARATPRVVEFSVIGCRKTGARRTYTRRAAN